MPDGGPNEVEVKVEIDGLDKLLENQKMILKMLNELENQTIPEWCTLSQAAELKNRSYETLKKHPEWGPDPGKAELVCGTRRWHKNVVSEWLLQGDEAS